MQYTDLWIRHGISDDSDNPISIVFIGAGFSCAIVPEAPNLAILGDNVCENMGKKRYNDRLIEVFNWHNSRASSNRRLHEINLEVLLEYYYEQGQPDEIREILKAMVPSLHKIESVRASAWYFNPKQSFLNTLKSIPGTKILVSFNYDTVLERVLGWENYGINWQYATQTQHYFGIRTPNILTDLDSSIDGDHSGARDITKSSGIDILVLKPHGSLNWTEYKTEGRGPSLVLATKDSHQEYFEQISPGDSSWTFKLLNIDHAPAPEFRRRQLLIVPPLPQKAPGPNVTFFHFRIMLEALRRATTVTSLGWSCPISDNNLLEALKFQFWERSEPLLRTSGVWKYSVNDPMLQIVNDRFKTIFPSLNQYMYHDGIDLNTFAELHEMMNPY